MAEKSRTYRVIAPRLDEPGPASFTDLGEHNAARAENAVEAAVDASTNGGIERAIAIPVGNWTECSVEEDPRPRFKARRINAPAEDPEPDPDPEL